MADRASSNRTAITLATQYLVRKRIVGRGDKNDAKALLFGSFLALAFFLISGCGGGGSSSSGDDSTAPPPQSPSSTRLLVQSDQISFVRDTTSGFDRTVSSLLDGLTDPQRFSGGVAAGDYDLDGDIDLYIVGRDEYPNHLYQNRGDGTFEEVGAELGVNVRHWGSGPAFGDIDGDGDLDLFVGAVERDPIYLFENRLNESEQKFVDITEESGLSIRSRNTVSALFFDYDLDGYLDLFLTHWGEEYEVGDDTETLWRNNGDRTFSSVSIETGIADALVEDTHDWSFTPNLTDIDGDQDADLLLASDYNESQVFQNNGDGTFTRTTSREVIVDQSGMGAAVGDYDNDGDMDWFVTSIYNLEIQGGEWFGNRIYRNIGEGKFEDATLGSRVHNGEWGWGTCAGDFDSDGFLDLVQVNGWITIQGKNYRGKPILFFHNRATGFFHFNEIADTVGLRNTGQGRGLVCFDADQDGDLDVIIINNSADHIVYYRNETTSAHHYLSIRLNGLTRNKFGVGARITVTTENGQQIRDLGGSNNYVSHNPLEAHFGLGTATSADIEVLWPDGTTTTLQSVQVDQRLTIEATETRQRLIVVQGKGAGEYSMGDEIAIEAQPAEEGYFFSHWTSLGGGSFADIYSSNTVFTMPADSVTVAAHFVPGVSAQEDVSVARRWNEVLLQAIRNDYARPTVHARNLFHISAAMFDIWTSFTNLESPWLLGTEQSEFRCEWQSGLEGRRIGPEPELADREKNREEAISYASYRLIKHRFQNSPRGSQIRRDADALMGYLGLDTSIETVDWEDGTPASLGNYVAQCYIDFGMDDGANEQNDYANLSYVPVNPPLRPENPGNPDIENMNRWQPLALEEFIDQAGNPSVSQPDFLSPEWGLVWPFALSDKDLNIQERDDFEYWLYHDPGGPPLIDGTMSDAYKWGFSLVAVWSSHLDPDDGVMMDISPASLGNIETYPRSSDYGNYDQFFDRVNGGDTSRGHLENPVTGLPYEAQNVPRGDYSRVLAEFWADGPDSETPPGHWFVILNEVNDHPLLERRIGGVGSLLDKLEWDVKGYFALGGAMHDAAIAAWSIKGWYDYIRPISAIRGMAEYGQSSDSNQLSFHTDGIPLVPGYIEVVTSSDSMAGEDEENVGKIKLLAWRGPDFIDVPTEDVAGVDWILADNWWPYQRFSFVTPPFAGFVSGHSTYSRSAAEVLTRLTGSAYFPGGMSQFEIPANDFLVFERGPTVDMTLQWATYYDASDQCSLSRIWGGIHPPADDIPGRLIGIKIGTDAFTHAMKYINGER